VVGHNMPHACLALAYFSNDIIEFIRRVPYSTGHPSQLATPIVPTMTLIHFFDSFKEISQVEP
jgi:hypothetical protein